MNACPTCTSGGQQTYFCKRYGCTPDTAAERAELAALLRETAHDNDQDPYHGVEPALLRRAADLLSRCPTCGSTNPCWSIFRVGRGHCDDDFHDGACRCEAVRKIGRTAARRELSRRTRAAELLDGDR